MIAAPQRRQQAAEGRINWRTGELVDDKPDTAVTLLPIITIIHAFRSMRLERESASLISTFVVLEHRACQGAVLDCVVQALVRVELRGDSTNHITDAPVLSRGDKQCRVAIALLMGGCSRRLVQTGRQTRYLLLGFLPDQAR